MARVLLVDDEPDVRKVLVEVSSTLGLVSETAEDGAVALRKLRAADFDLVLLDLNMPRLDGFGVLEALRDEPSGGRPAVIIVTSSPAPADRLRGLELGALDFVEKPFRVADLRRRMERALVVLDLERRLTEAEQALRQAQGTDADLGVGSCHQLFEALDAEFRAAREGRQALSCVIVADERYGHGTDPAALERDTARLQQVADLLATCHGEGAQIFRVGADELVVVLPGVTATQVRAVVDQMVSALKRLSSVSAAFALGAASYPHPAIEQSNQLLRAVNLCLAKARARRHDRVIFGPDESA